MTRIKIDGKYVIQHDNGVGLKALRHGEPWRDLCGDGLVLAMAQRIEELEEELAHPAIDAVKVRDEWVPDMAFAADGWANVAYNGLQHLRNLQDGIGTIEKSIENMEQCCKDAQATWQLALKSPPLPSTPVSAQQVMSDEEILDFAVHHFGAEKTHSMIIIDGRSFFHSRFINYSRALLQKAGASGRDERKAAEINELAATQNTLDNMVEQLDAIYRKYPHIADEVENGSIADVKETGNEQL